MTTVDFFLPELAGGGAERVVVDLTARLVEHGLDVRLVLARAAGPLLSEVDPRVDLVDLGASRTVTALLALTSHLRRSCPDALISSLTHANVLAVVARALARRNVPLVLLEQNTLSRAALTGLRRDRVLPHAARHAYPRADAVVACSAGVAEDLAGVTGLGPERITTIPLPVITPSVIAASTQPVTDPWFTANRPAVVAAGRLVPQKGFDVLIAAFADALPERTAYLTILGEGPERSRLEDHVARLGLTAHVRMPGYVEDVYAWIAQADVFALPSRYEGMPNVLVAALALGTPIVATDCPSGPRELLRDGALGALVPVEDRSALARAIVGALDRPPAPAPAKAWEDYTLERATARYLEILSKLVDGGIHISRPAAG